MTTITDVIEPTNEPSVYDTNDAAIQALNAKQIDGVVVDLPTAFFMTDVQLDDRQIVGQFEGRHRREHFSRRPRPRTAR